MLLRALEHYLALLPNGVQTVRNALPHYLTLLLIDRVRLLPQQQRAADRELSVTTKKLKPRSAEKNVKNRRKKMLLPF